MSLYDKIKRKSNWNSLIKINKLMRELKTKLIFQGEPEETQKDLWKAIDNIKTCLDNLEKKR